MDWFVESDDDDDAASYYYITESQLNIPSELTVS